MNEELTSVILKQFDKPDEVTLFEKGRFETIKVGEMTIGRATYEPGWRWSEHIGPTVKRRLCEVKHIGMVVSGTATAAIEGREVIELRPGDVFYIPPIAHDSWVVGDEPYVSLHFLGAGKYTKE